MNQRAKTHPSQWNIFLDFAEKNPVVLTKKFDGPFGRDKYNKLWRELTTSLNSMGYIQKSIKKWQKAVGDWKGKVKAKAALIKMELKKTGGGTPAAPPLSETEKRLIGLMGWTSIRGDENLELGAISGSVSSPSTSIGSPLTNIGAPLTSTFLDTQIEIEHNYPFQVRPPQLKNVSISPPPLVELSKDNDDVGTPCKSTSVAKSRKRKLKNPSVSKLKWGNKLNCEKMHEDTMGILKEINSNVTRLANAQERMCEIHSKIFDHLISNYELSDIQSVGT